MLKKVPSAWENVAELFSTCISQFSRSVISDSLRPLSITNSRSPPKPMSIESVMPSNHLIFCHPFSSCLQSFPASGSFPMSQLFTSGGQSIGASASASVLLVNIQVWPPCPPRDSQESSPTPQFKSISSSVFSFLYSPTLISIHDYWKNRCFDQMDLCWQCLCF